MAISHVEYLHSLGAILKSHQFEDAGYRDMGHFIPRHTSTLL